MVKFQISMVKRRRRRTARRPRRRQKGKGLDIQKWLAKPGIEWHVPGYQFSGPGTKLQKRLKRGNKGINRLDRIAKQHDIDYTAGRSLKDKHKADRKMIKSIERLPGSKTLTEHAIKKIMQAKVGLNL